MMELSELYKLRNFNKWVKDNVGGENLSLTVDLPSIEVKYPLKDMAALESKIYKYECKLTPEQLVVAFTKANKQAEELIEEEKQRLGWTNWISTSVLNFMGYGTHKEEAKAENEQEEIESIMKKLEDFDHVSETSSAIQEFSAKQDVLSEHLVLNIPLIQFSLVNKSMH
jgi:GTPase involved in cell partitioning and DNA repair